MVKVPIHKFHAYHVTRRHQCVCLKIAVRRKKKSLLVSRIFVFAVTDVSPVTQNFHCTFNAFYEIIQQLWCSDLSIDSALLFIATVFSSVRIVDLVQVGSERVFQS